MITQHRSMARLSPATQATKALLHFLTRVAESPEVGWYCGCGTETFALCTEAYAALTGQAVKAVRVQFAPRNATNPCESSSAVVKTMLDADDVALLRSLIEHHEKQADEVNAAAAVTKGLAFDLYQRADEHSFWAEDIQQLLEREGVAEK